MQKLFKFFAFFFFILLALDVYATGYMSQHFNDGGNYLDFLRSLIVMGAYITIFTWKKIRPQGKVKHRVHIIGVIFGCIVLLSLALRIAEVHYNYRLDRHRLSYMEELPDKIIELLGTPQKTTQGLSGQKIFVEHYTIDKLWEYCLPPARNAGCYKIFIDEGKVIRAQPSWGDHKISFILPYLYDWWVWNTVFGLAPHPERLFD